MGTLDIFTNAPGMLRVESLNITVRFERTGPYTGRISWNIPTPAAGCTSDNQAYCGMLVTVNTVAQTIDMAPVNGTVYKSDPTVDPNLFAGDTIQGAQVVGAFYNDRTTTMFDITGLMPNTPYYITAYPVDCVLRYFREGVSAFSLNYETGHGTPGKPGHQLIWTYPANPDQSSIMDISGDINFVQPPPKGVSPSDPTCLAPNVMYEFGLHLTGEGFDKKYTININGLYGMLWGDLVAEMNKQFLLIDNPPQGPFPPNTGGLYYNQSTNQLFQWDGYVNIQLPVLVSDTPPNQVNIGDYWFNTTNNTLYIWNGLSWDVVTVISFATDPTQPICDQSFWFDGTQGYLWNGTTWCSVPTLISDIDPSLPPSNLCDTYWLEPLTHQFFRYNEATSSWDLILPVEYLSDPNTLAMGSYWFDSTNNLLFQHDTPNPGWNEVFVRIDETEPLNPAPGVLWYNPLTQELKQWDDLNTEWDDVNSITYPVDPTIRETCDYWFETDTDTLWIWDIVNSVWVEVNLLIQEIDPALPPVILDGSVWFDPITGKFYKWKGTACDPSWEEVEFIFYPTNPLNPGIGTVWHDTTSNVWYVWNGVAWIAIDPLYSPTDPTMIPAGTYWYNPTNEGLSYWNGIVWISVMYSTVPLSPSVGTVWFNTTTGQLLTWNGISWQNTLPKATAELDVNGNLLLSTTERSSLAMISVYDTGTLFPNLCNGVSFRPMICGADGVSDEPTYNQLGVGTDGSLDERLEIANEIRYNLGYPIVDVELSKENIDICITQAIREVRQKTAIGYKHGFFFMSMQPGVQNYILSNKNNGMNKIVNIMGIYRLTSAFISSAHGAGVYGQIVLQHLYNMGNFDLLSYHIISEYVHLMEILFAARLTFTWDEQTRTVFIFHRFTFPEMVAVEASIERTEQDIMSDRWVKPWVIKFATARAMSMLAEVRGKFSTLPSANGGVTLNSQDLRSRAKEIYDECALEIENYQADKPEDFGMGSQFTFG